MALLWIKVLGYLKIVNKQMATFITSLIHIIAGIRYVQELPSNAGK